MSLRNDTFSPVRLNYPIATEFAIVIAVLIGLSLWQGVVTGVFSAVVASSSTFGLLFTSLLTGGLSVLGLVVFAGAYATSRDIEIGSMLPSRTALPSVALAVLAPLGLVGLTALVGSLTRVPYSALTKSSYAADASVMPVVLTSGLAIIVGVPALVVVCQVLVQGSFERVTGGEKAALLTTLVTGFVMVNSTGRLATVPDLGKLVGAVVFTLLLGGALYARERVARDRVRYLAVLPVVVFAALVVLSGVAGIDSIAGGLFAATQLAVLAVAASTYERTNSLLVPALAYVSLLLANRAVVFVFETGLGNW